VAEHLSDEEQLEALKRWWQESGKQTLAVIAIAVVGYFGWNGWQDHRQQQAEGASSLYDQMISAASITPGEALTDEQQAQVTFYAVSLQDQYSGTAYAQYASLMLAKLAVEDNDLDTAATELTSVMADAEEGLSLIARLRLARVEAARGNADQALALLSDVDAKTLSFAYDEARGDIYLQQGDVEKANTAYQQALAQMPLEDRTRPLLELKLNQTTSQKAEQTDTENSGDAS
jgi:predicted negative regulator of RcsB-dependent stress response